MIATDQVLPAWAYVAGVGLTGVASVASVFVARSGKNAAKDAAKEATERIGKPNGQGNVVEMLERTLLKLGEISGKVEDLDERLDLQESRYLDHAPAFKQLLAQSKHHEEVLQKLVDKPQTVSILPVAMPKEGG